jgi:hypothetical protein
LGFNGAAGMGGFDSRRMEEPRYGQRDDGERYGDDRYGDRYDDRRYEGSRFEGSRYDDSRVDAYRENGDVDRGDAGNGFDNRRAPRAAAAGGTPRQDPFEGDPWGED